MIIRLCFRWCIGKLVSFSYGGRVFDSFTFFSFMLLPWYPKVSIYIKLDMIIRLCFRWCTGKLVGLSYGGRVFDSFTFFSFMFLLYFYDFVQKIFLTGNRTHTPSYAIIQNQPPKPVNNFDDFYR